MNGTSVLLTAETATPGVYVAIGSQRDVTINESTAVIDESSKDLADFVGSAGRRTVTIDCGALYVPADAAYVLLRDARRAGTLIRVEYSEAGSDVENIDCIVTSISRSAPDQGEAVVSISLQGSGAWAAAA